MDITEKVAYLKGLVEGLGLDDSTKEGKVLKVIIDLLDDMALSLVDVDEGMSLLSDQLDILDDELGELQEDFYEDEEEDEDEEYKCCGHHHHHHDEDGELYEVTCPACGDTVYVDEDMLDEGEINCPGCGQSLEFDLSGALEGCDGGFEDEEDETEEDSGKA